MKEVRLKIIHFEDQPTETSWIPDALLNRFVRLSPNVVDRMVDDGVGDRLTQRIPGKVEGVDVVVDYVVYDDESGLAEEIQRADSTTIYILDVIFGREFSGIDVWRELSAKIDVERQVLFLTAYPARVREELNLETDSAWLIRKPPSHTQFIDILLDRLKRLAFARRGGDDP